MQDQQEHKQGRSAKPPVQIQNVEPTPIGQPAVPEPVPRYRAVSMAGWGLVALAFIINRKLGVLVLLFMLLFVVFPGLTSSKIARGAGNTWTKLRRLGRD